MGGGKFKKRKGGERKGGRGGGKKGGRAGKKELTELGFGLLKLFEGSVQTIRQQGGRLQ